MGTNEQGYHLLWPDLPIFSENQFTARPTPSVLCCLRLRPKTVADFVQLRRARYGNTAYACCLLVFPSSNPRMKPLLLFLQTLVPLSLAATNGVSVDFPSFSYSDVSVR